MPETKQNGSGSSAPTKGSALVYFAKEPRPGQVKTRLCPPLTPAEAAGLYRGFLSDILRAPGEHRSLVYGCSEGDMDELASLLPKGMELRRQRGDDLWQRILCCQEELLQEGHERVLIRNTDSPDLPPAVIEAAFEVCRPGRVVLGPDQGGGYYLIAVSELHRALFRGLEEGSSSVHVATMANARRLGLEVVELATYPDVDRYADLLALWQGRLGQ